MAFTVLLFYYNKIQEERDAKQLSLRITTVFFDDDVNDDDDDD
jgi:hypothetical protein